MSGAAGGAAVGAHAAAIAQAIKASGAIVRLEPDGFLTILSRQEKPLVIHSTATFFGTHRYLCSYRGLAFFAKSADPLSLPADSEIIEAGKIWIPG